MSKTVLISIDTEAPCGSDPVRHMIYGESRDGQKVGIERLMDIFDLYQVQGLFFVDIAEAWGYGEDKMAEIMRLIKNRGHDVGVHIHPDHMADVGRRFLWQYSYDEQYKIISLCTDFYMNVLGERPLSFRAGRYGLNYETLDIIDKLGYKYDMSEFYGNKRCGLKPHLTCNGVVNYKGITEIPVSVYKSFSFLSYQRFDKMDISLGKCEFDWLSKKMVEDKDIDVISFFVHSFSLLNWRRHVDDPIFMKNEEEKMKYMLGCLKTLGCDFVTESSLAKLEFKSHKNEIVETDYSGGFQSWLFSFNRAVKIVRDKLENDI